MIGFNASYLYFAVLLFITEVCIAVFVHDSFVRPYLGDVLVVILLYCFFKIFLKTNVLKMAFAVLLMCFFIEFLQYIAILKTLHLQNVQWLQIVLGHSFSWLDMLCYMTGFFLILFLEYNIRPLLNFNQNKNKFSKK
ncbi:DUF2809 domain-containing protein [Flavobacterium branchiophilum]|uniref:Hypothetical transmembrane protein n=1 Tax=Flavobacterium branchiophilum (strain FL-15) TaxID=1034807 RepID=G2Z6H7_FLABF|nr:DUF2809 domain-containing protein [Flavobacterium branchiophilum]CCB71007.1 Hypothetical transmembrane protein [Flavobacterium branchiophilum FL-15]